MPEKSTKERVRRARRAGKAPSTQAGEFVREEIRHVRSGKHGVSSPKQAIAIGLSKARRAGVALPPPKKRATSEATRKKAERDFEVGQKRSSRSPARASSTQPTKRRASSAKKGTRKAASAPKRAPRGGRRAA
jgi:hypothetical protein